MTEKKLVEITIDDRTVEVPEGTNLIDAAQAAGLEIPHYCYHPHLSVPGNCRMCQVEVEGAPKLTIGCNTAAKAGMKVRTHLTSDKVRDAQAATLEFILINHPLDCTVCDQAGHCKLQDYHYEYNARPSRFIEDKVHKPKAKPLGPTVILDAERCIMCTRCVRFCDEVTGTGELGMFNRGDRSEIGVFEGRPLDNPLSGSVVDLCPVGALTHRKWRFNTRIWFTRQSEGICPGCSTGCNVKVAVRDSQVVQVKARLNSDVNKEWLCDEGRYGFHRFLPDERVLTPLVGGIAAKYDAAIKEAGFLKTGKTLVLAAPDLFLEEYAVLQSVVFSQLKGAVAALQYEERSLTPVEAVLISPDYAANFRGAAFVGIAPKEFFDGETGETTAGCPDLKDLEGRYHGALEALNEGTFDNLLLVGDRSLSDRSLADGALIEALRRKVKVCAIVSDMDRVRRLEPAVVFPDRSILEKAGMLINRGRRLQYAERVIEPPIGTFSSWKVLNDLAKSFGEEIVSAQSDRELTLAYLAHEDRFTGLTIRSIKAGGVSIPELLQAKTNRSTGSVDSGSGDSGSGDSGSVAVESVATGQV